MARAPPRGLRAALAKVPAHPDKQGGGPVSERLVREPTRHRVPGRSLGTTPPTPRIGRHRPALDRGSIRLDQLADGDKVELVEAAEHGQVRGRESRVKHVEVFRDGEREELPSSGRPRPLPGHQRAQPTTPSIVKSPILQGRDHEVVYFSFFLGPSDKAFDDAAGQLGLSLCQITRLFWVELPM